jgi:flagellar protein FliL
MGLMRPASTERAAMNSTEGSQMSSKSEVQGEAEVQGGGGKKKKGLLLAVAAGVLVMLALGGGGAWFFLSGENQDTAAAAVTVKPKPKDEPAPVFVTLDPFVVNLAGEASHYLQVGIDLKVADAEVPDQIKTRLPEIRNAVLLLLSSKQADELGTLDGKNRLRQEIRGAVNRPLGIETPLPPVPATAGDSHAAQSGPGVGEAHASEAPAGAAPEHADPAHAQGVLDVLLTSFVIQ